MTTTSSITDGSRRAALMRIVAGIVLVPVVLFIALVTVNTILAYGAPLLALPALYALWVVTADAVALVRDRPVVPRPGFRWFLASAGVLVLWLFYMFRGFELVFGLNI